MTIAKIELKKIHAHIFFLLSFHSILVSYFSFSYLDQTKKMNRMWKYVLPILVHIIIITTCLIRLQDQCKDYSISLISCFLMHIEFTIVVIASSYPDLRYIEAFALLVFVMCIILIAFYLFVTFGIVCQEKDLLFWICWILHGLFITAFTVLTGVFTAVSWFE